MNETQYLACMFMTVTYLVTHYIYARWMSIVCIGCEFHTGIVNKQEILPAHVSCNE